jgi:hypothetical protein
MNSSSHICPSLQDLWMCHLLSVYLKDEMGGRPAKQNKTEKQVVFAYQT